MPERVECGVVAGVESLEGHLWLLHLAFPALATQVQPGHFLNLRCADLEAPAFDPYLPRAYFVVAADRQAGRLSLLVERRGRGSDWLTRRQEGDAVLAHGPLGRPVAPDRLTRHLLLLADGVVAVAALAFLAGEAVRRGLSVTVVENVLSDAGGTPARLLRADVEYRTTTPAAGGLLGTLPGLLSWADEVLVAGSPTLLDTLAALRRSRLAPFTLHANLPVQALLLPDPASGFGYGGTDQATSDGSGGWLPCGTGVCGACAVPTRSGAALYCREGPAFPLHELRLVLEDEHTLGQPDQPGDQPDQPGESHHASLTDD